MFNTLRYAYHLTKAEKLIKKGATLEDERVKHHQEKVRTALYEKKKSV